MADSKLRQRKAKAEEERDEKKADDVNQDEDGEDGETDAPLQKTKTRAKVRVDEEDEYSPWVDVLRVLTFLLLASCGLSYVVTGGESWVWGGVKLPQYARLAYWKAQLVSSAPTMTRLPPSITNAG
jgi:hypothetical protein